MPTVSIAQRLFSLERVFLVLLLLVALVSSIASLRRDRRDHKSQIIAAATLTQLVLILVDPSPFTYVYGWSLVPTLVGVAAAPEVLGRPFKYALQLGGVALAMILLSLNVAYVGLKRAVPPTGSAIRLTLDAPVSRTSVASLPTADLVQMMLRGDHQHNLMNMILIRSLVCERIKGEVLSSFTQHPVCLPDSTYYWVPELFWPDLTGGGAHSPNAASFNRVIQDHPPVLFIWSRMLDDPKLSPWAKPALAGFDSFPGFALRAPTPGSQPSSDAKGAGR